ncbi:MFS transporter [Lipingzhangella sp. LS1_29]|uniref:MFS transporter n=1 Tax=Lipingzhangella rawalii TaxID=2055835 RepID=A0ABU2HBF1_9ACTN|nr:MFS transporter [Lipingzhangella rawalii]MDS1272611.1 MFS transporter [Lipingzhangella rawalii]
MTEAALRQPDSPWPGHHAGTRAYVRVLTAMTAAGIATFSQLYSVQAILPDLAVRFEASPARVALTVSLATGALAGFVLLWSGVADRFGRARVMGLALIASTTLGLLAPLVDHLWLLLILRTVQGAVLGGMPAVAVAYLADEIYAGHLTRATGAYVAGNTLGGMSGRLVAGLVADLAGWRWALAADSLLAVLAVAVFLVALPRPRGFVASHGADAGLRRRIRTSLADRGLLALYAQALLLMGAFVTVYNFLAFHLLDAPFALSPALVSLVFLAYLAGSLSSSVTGRITERLGRHRLLLGATALMVTGMAGLLAPTLPVVLAALVIFTVAFFAAHTVAAGWVGQRARTARAQASACYTLAYYLGSSLFGWLGGLVYAALGWSGTAGYVIALCLLAASATLALRDPPHGTPAGPGHERTRDHTVTSAPRPDTRTAAE